MDDNLRKELHEYCKNKYEYRVSQYQRRLAIWQQDGKRPKDSDGIDILDRMRKEIDMYHSGMIEFS